MISKTISRRSFLKASAAGRRRADAHIVAECPGNRLHDSIGIFSIGETGALTFIGEEWTRGDYPRSFNVDPGGNFLYSCNQRGDTIAAFRIDRKSGGLAFTGHFTPVGNPSIIVFLDLGKAG
jgi:6-phosphogluconolactonase (cycloisomerase 2 family)